MYVTLGVWPYIQCHVAAVQSHRIPPVSTHWCACSSYTAIIRVALDEVAGGTSSSLSDRSESAVSITVSQAQ